MITCIYLANKKHCVHLIEHTDCNIHGSIDASIELDGHRPPAMASTQEQVGLDVADDLSLDIQTSVGPL